MVNVSIHEGVLNLKVQRWSKVWSLKGGLSVPIANVKSVRHDPDAARGLWKGWRLPGTHIPGWITAGTFYKGGEKIFWDVRDPKGTLVFEIADHSYDRLIVEVSDPEATVRKVRAAIEAAAVIPPKRSTA